MHFLDASGPVCAPLPNGVDLLRKDSCLSIYTCLPFKSIGMHQNASQLTFCT